jgi:uncharacterized coiled-coil protein SlyX
MERGKSVSTEWQQRLETLEINQAYQEENLEKLSQQVRLQQKEIDTLQRQIKNLLKQLASHTETHAASTPVFNPEDEVPPHY